MHLANNYTNDVKRIESYAGYESARPMKAQLPEHRFTHFETAGGAVIVAI